MGDGWSLDHELIPSNEPTTHPDPRMHWKIGAGDVDACSIQHRDWRKPQPLTLSQYAGKHALHSQDYLTEPAPPLINAELKAAFQMARERLLDAIDAELAKLAAELRGRS